MKFRIRLGLPEMDALWSDLVSRQKTGRLSDPELQLWKKLGKAMALLAENPRHNGLQSHEITSLSRKHGMRIYQSYLENRKPAAGRLFWAYGPEQGDITVLAVEPHPEDAKREAYERVKLSRLPSIEDPTKTKGNPRR